MDAYVMCPSEAGVALSSGTRAHTPHTLSAHDPYTLHTPSTLHTVALVSTLFCLMVLYGTFTKAARLYKRPILLKAKSPNHAPTHIKKHAGQRDMS